MFNWKSTIDTKSIFNTTPVFAVYMTGVYADFINKNGGVQYFEDLAERRSKLLYDKRVLDNDNIVNLKKEGNAREFINKIQNLRKDSDFEVTDRISLTIVKRDEFNKAILNYKDYICAQTLANQLELVDNLNDTNTKTVEIDKDLFAQILVKREKNLI